MELRDQSLFESRGRLEILTDEVDRSERGIIFLEGLMRQMEQEQEFLKLAKQRLKDERSSLSRLFGSDELISFDQDYRAKRA